VLRDRDIVYFSCVDWGPGRARPQQLAIELASTNRVLYVEPMISVVSYLQRLVQQEGARAVAPGLRRLHHRLFVYTPRPLLPFSLRSERLNAINKTFLLRAIRKTMEVLELRRPIVAVSHPSHHELVGRLDEELSFYDCMDLYPVLPDRRADPEVLAAMEHKLLEKVDLVFVTSERLQDGRDKGRGKGALVRNGVDLAHFGFGRSGPWVGQADEELACIPRPIIGYMGCLGAWFDTEAVAHLAASRPDVSVVLIGPVQERSVARRLRPYRNIYLLGAKPYQELPRYLEAFAVCLIPFRLNELTRAVNPIKLYEYLAAGKPVVAADLDEVRPFRGIVSIYATHQEFVAHVEQALREENPELVHLRVSVARENTWGRRVEELGSALAGHLKKSLDMRSSEGI